jgi:soluble lytic murein transglycosylase-like protein
MRFCLELILGVAVLGTLSVDRAPAASLPASNAPRAIWVVKVDTHTGKLVRTLVASKPVAGTDADVRGLVADAAKSFDVNPLLVDSVIQVESNYNPFAISPKGAQGLMQLMPATALRYGVTDSFDPKQNIEAGVRYLKFLQDTFQDDRLAIAAYNAGEKAVAKYKDVPPYPETVNYVDKVGKKFGRAKREALNSTAALNNKEKDNESKHEATNAAEPKPGEEAPRHILAYVDTEGKLHIATR